MSSVLDDTLRRVTGQSSAVVDRVDGLHRAVEAARGRLDDKLLAQADVVLERAGGRLKLSDQHTIVALAGATGSGKSSLFNALCGLELAAVGVKRPTTSWALACSWGPAGAGELLDWLGIPKRHQVNRMGMLDETAEEREMQGLVLLDLPDHDSTEVSHHLEVERLITLTDVFLWVLDPQKYADAAIHDRFLRPLASHSDVMMVALNHVDEIPPDGVESCLADVDRLLKLDGLDGVPVIATSATRGDGLSDLRQALISRVSQKSFAQERLVSDIRAIGERMAAKTGNAQPPDLTTTVHDELLDACAEAAGVPTVVDAVYSTSLLRAKQQTGWPLTSWMSRVKRNPVRALKSIGGEEDQASLEAAEGAEALQSRDIEPDVVNRARLDAAVRTVSDHVTDGMPEAWAGRIRAASTSRLDEFTEGLNAAVGRTDLGVSTEPWWWRGTKILQWLLLIAGVVGLGWLAVLGVMSLSGSEPPNTPTYGLKLPALLAIGGFGIGLLLAIICRLAINRSAAGRAARAKERLLGSIADVADDLVVVPMTAEVEAYIVCRDGLAVALAA